MSKRILVVDDESDVCLALKRILDENGFTVDSYQNPLLALQKFKADLYDLVILDIKMPKLNGFVLFYTERSRDWIKWSRFVFLRPVKCITAYIQIYFLQYLPITLRESQLIMKSL